MGGYKEHKLFDMLKRKSIIIKYVFLIVFIFFITGALMSRTVTNEKTKDIIYTENSKLDYKVYLKENEFFEKDYLEENNQYIASLIDYISANFNYELTSDTPDVDFKYTYKVLAEVKVVDNKTSNPLYQKSEELVEQKEYKANTDTKLKIKESLKIDYNKYNDMIKDFISMYDLSENKATIAINLYVDLVDDKPASKTPAVSLSMPLTTKTMAINMESNTVNANNIISKSMETNRNLFISLLLTLLDIFLIYKLVRFMKDTKDQKSVYKMALRKIMANYGSYIQKLNNELTFDDCQLLEIKSFEDLLQIRETINKPILMTEKASVMETYFFIPNDKDVYVYEFKVGNLRKRRGSRYKTKETEE